MKNATSLTAATLLCALAMDAPAQDYTVTDLGSIDGTNSFGWGINDRGDVTGWSSTFGQYDEAFLWTAEAGMLGLGTVFGTSASYGLGVNDAQRVAGYSGLSFEDTRAFITSPGGLTDLGSLGGPEVWARAIDNASQIVGESDTAAGERHVFLWKAGQMTDVGTLPGTTFANAAAVSDAGHIAGNAGSPFLWRAGAFTILPTLGGSSFTRDVNDFGHAVGSSALGTGGCQTCDTRAASWRNGGVVNLGMLAPPGTPFMTSVAQSVNNADAIVGYSTTVLGKSAFLCENGCPGGLTDLNDHLPPDWHVSEAYAINDAGQIVAIGSFGAFGLQRALLLTPAHPRLVLINPQPGRAGAVNAIQTRWATPAARVLVVFGTRTGQSAAPACDATFRIARARVVGVAVADGAGVATVSLPVPAGLAGRRLVFQALDLSTCTTSAISTQLF